MKDYLKSKGFIILAAVVLIFLGVLMYTVSIGESSISSLLGFITTPMQKVSTSISNAANQTAQEKKTIDELQAQIDDLQKQVQNLRAITVDYYDIKKENAQFLKYYDLKQKDNTLKFVPATVIGRDPNENFYGFTLDEGSVSGILENDPVITENGLIGWVYHVEANSCKVRTILSPETKVGAIDVSTDDSGVVEGSMPLADQNLVKLRYIQAENTIKPGDILVTSGLSGIFPKNLQIGEILEIKNEDYDASYYALVKPFEDVRIVRDVFIVTDFQGKAQISTAPAKQQLEQVKNSVG